jgi:hypothetical protein
MHEFVETGSAPAAAPWVCVQPALQMGYFEMEDVPYGTCLSFRHSICSVRNISGARTFWGADLAGRFGFVHVAPMMEAWVARVRHALRHRRGVRTERPSLTPTVGWERDRYFDGRASASGQTPWWRWSGRLPPTTRGDRLSNTPWRQRTESLSPKVQTSQANRGTGFRLGSMGAVRIKGQALGSECHGEGQTSSGRQNVCPPWDRGIGIKGQAF